MLVGKPEYQEKTTDLPQVTDKLGRYRMMSNQQRAQRDDADKNCRQHFVLVYNAEK